jgi:hypothetical protein
MGEEINIIQSGWKHHALLAELGAATFFETFIDYHDENDLRQYINKTYSIEQLKKNVADNRIHYFTAYDNEGDVGYIKLIDDVKPGGLEGKIITLRKLGVPYPEGFEKDAAKNAEQQAELIAADLKKSKVDVLYSFM